METVLYLGTDRGVVVMRSPDGRSFDVAQHQLKEWAIPEVAFIPGEPNKALAGTRGDGVWYSEDYGASWSKPSYGKRGPGKVRCVTVDPHDSKRVYAGTEPIDVFVSDDLAKSWVRLEGVWDVPSVPSVTYPVAVVEPHVRDITIDPKDPKTMYAALQVGYIVKSTDGGETWKLLDRNLDCDVHTMVVDPRNSDRMIVATGGHDSRGGKAPGRALYATDDGGANWSPLAMTFQQEYSVPLVMDPSNPDVLFSCLAVGQPNVWRQSGNANSMVIRSKDGGANWERVGNGQPSSIGFAEAITIDDEDPNRVYAVFRSGELHLSQDGGDTWELLETKVPGGVSSMKLAHA